MELIESLIQQAEVCEVCGAEDEDHEASERDAAALMRFEALLFRRAAAEIDRLRGLLNDRGIDAGSEYICKCGLRREPHRNDDGF